MLTNFFKVALRNFWRNKGFSGINILGLAIGMAAAILILLWVQNEMGTDRFFSNTSQLYIMYNRDTVAGQVHCWNNTTNKLAPVLKTDFSEVENSARYRNVTFLMTMGEKHLNAHGAFADSSFLSLFNFPLASGTAANSLNGAGKIVLTQKLATNLFGKEDPIGKMVRIDTADNFMVAAVLKDLPPNTTFDFDYLLPWQYLNKLGWLADNWDINSANTFVLLKPGASQSAFDSHVKDLISKNSVASTKLFSQSMDRAYLYGKDENGKLVGGRIVTVRLFALIAAFILLIACINFMNLSTARSEKRAREVGVRKVIGARRGSLIASFIFESILLSAFAFFVASFLVQVSLKSYNELTGKELRIDYTNYWYWLSAAAFILFTGFLAGSYPAFYLSSFRPVKVLKGKLAAVGALVNTRKALVILQFSFALVLIVSTIIVERQIKYAQQRDTGYNKNNLIFTFTQGEVAKNYELIKNELLSSGAASSVTKSANPMTRRWGGVWGYSWDGSTEDDRKVEFVPMGADADFVKTMGVSLLSGRDIDINAFPSDTSAVMLNEAAVKAMRLTNPIGKIIRHYGQSDLHVVGIVKDFILESPYDSKINPMLIQGPAYFFQVMHIKLNPANSTASNLAKAEQIFKRYNPQYPFEYIFVNEAYAQKFSEERRIGTLAALFAGFSIFISCLGLFGLAAYLAESRRKEIGVRKVLGASAAGIAAMLSKEFVQLVLIALLVATPIAYYAMNNWLSGFTYRVNMGWWIFVLAGLIAVVIAVVTVSFQAVKAALANPVKSLRSE